ncbi:DegT/DnrJ/EryC1/StrS family aminotransferase [Leptothoe spongobia]|uniref:DegT/DnrJ/EryC1/StrS family aminotransferase n=1 Tax=Leptothoe spongobia TAU-MAC 1115 TaxID=1967444 RepID=A0A947DEW4_9CYAN|nr:DegT/DnrJ/EryC1/StrS family aminotransferase [Leptothoe spongobia]MBT9315650.1 DegT/DnrJ/EryC1/StrS family aminotransferase [Leptothoe spongobia TAU-MAC 1115]
MKPHILLSPPHMGDKEFAFVKEAFDTNWLAPVGPHINAFEEEFCQITGAKAAAAVSSGTAALHLALRLLDIGSGDDVICSSLTFIATANPILYQGAKPVFIDSESTSWNMDPQLVVDTLNQRAKAGNLPKAVILVHLYGQCADIDPILEVCQKYDIPLIEDAAEALGASYKGKAPGILGQFGIYSFNGNKIITTSGGGMLVSDNPDAITKARFLATQARDPAPHYQHSEVGYNYRLSNVLAGMGRGQLQVLKDRVAARRQNFEFYRSALEHLPGITFMPEASYGQSTRWLTCLTVDPQATGIDRDQIRLALAKENIESRPVWKPMHLQPVFTDCEYIGGDISAQLFQHGLCLPSGSAMTKSDLERVTQAILELY